MATKQQEELCSECDVNAKWYCIQDAANFCDQHNTMAHSFRFQKSHKIVSINEKAAIIREQSAKPINCKNHHMPLCLYCLSCKDVCCVACLSVDIHKQHSDQVKSVVDVANEEKKILKEHLENMEKLQTVLIDEQHQLEEKLQNVATSEAKSNAEIDTAFDQIISAVETRRKIIKEQLQKKSKMCHDNIHSRQEDMENIISSLNRCLEEGRHLLTLNDFAALSQSNIILQKMKKLEVENTEYRQQVPLIDTVPFSISSQTLLEMISTLGIVGPPPPAPLFAQQKCKASDTYFDVEWEPIECNVPITAYILELGQNENNFNEVYRGKETKYHLQDLQRSTSYVLRLCASHGEEAGNTALLQMKTLNVDLNNWTLSMSSIYTQLNSGNTRESLLDGQFTTGAAAYTSGSTNEWIQATFPSPVPVNSVIIAPLHTDISVWTPTCGSGGSLQYSHDNENWITIGTITYINMQQQKIEVGSITAQYWRLFYRTHLGTSSFLFK